MRTYLCLIAALQLILAGSAQAEVPAPTCAQMRGGYQAIVQNPVRLDDDSLVLIAKAFAEHKLFVNADRTEYLSAEDIARFLASRTPIDALTWISWQYVHLENRMRTDKCEFEKKDVHLMLPRLPENSCKAPAVLPKKLLR